MRLSATTVPTWHLLIKHAGAEFAQVMSAESAGGDEEAAGSQASVDLEQHLSRDSEQRAETVGWNGFLVLHFQATFTVMSANNFQSYV